jgi:hypothetical protein
MTAPTPPRRGQDALDALADAFDAVAPQDRAAAEQELLDAGVDPRAVARRGTELAPGGPRRAGTPPPPAAVATTRHWHRWAIAAALLLAIGAALLAGRARPERSARIAPAPRAIEPPSRVVPPAVEPGGSDPAVARPDGPRSKGGSRSAGGAGGRRGGDSAPLAPEQAALLPLLPEALEPLLRRRIVGVREVAVDPAVVAGLQSPEFLAASAANANRFEIAPSCRLRPRGRGVPVPERFGYPFPTVDPASPTAACEIVWNAEAAFAAGGGRRGRATACGGESGYSDGGEEQATQCWEARFASLAFAGRPGGPIDNPDELRASSMLRVDGLPDAAGVALLSQHPLGDDAAKHWHYIGRSRRVSRETTPHPPVADNRLRLSLDDFDCFAAAPEHYQWKLLGQREILAPLSGEGIALPSATDAPEMGKGGDEVLTAMRRKAWVVQGTRNDSGSDRIVLYIDAELYRPYWKVESQSGYGVATFACGAGWTTAGDGVVPLTSSVLRIDGRTGRIDRLVPYDEVIDPALRNDDVSLKMLPTMDR